ncbi:tRNA lysidine(34) synthetase TilS [Marinomonas atlantica]|uniref:tRNA lysidine(34) synthetase TilS n=1 Tax=Marinomonas atlantica TaxID=1806668 RepID=UPI00083261A5|nr:tRNA lysidine(34) synthetase TilS [Marinomonas atlantica]
MIVLSTETLQRLLGEQGKIYIAYSGGMDSHVLLHCVMRQLSSDLRSRVSAIHIHHGLSDNADAWALHCQTICDGYQIPLFNERVTLDTHQSLEEQARRKRYEVFERYLENGDVLLQGHHANDQAETLLFRLERGTGWRGIQGIPAQRPLGLGQLWRPLLTISRQVLMEYAQQQSLHWIEDESNADVRFRRNFLRHQVIEPWEDNDGALMAQVAKSAEFMQSEGRVIERLIRTTLQTHINETGGLNLASLPVDERAFWLSSYLKEQNVSLTQAQLSAVVAMFYGAQSKQPLYQTSGYRLVRYIEHLYVLPEERLPVLGALKKRVWFEREFDCIRCSEAVELKSRPEGERLLLANGKHRSLKKWLQDQRIPIWWRDHLPYIYQADTLVAIGDLWQHPEAILTVEWHRNERLCWPN